MCVCAGSKESGTEFILVNECVIVNHQCSAVVIADFSYMYMSQALHPADKELMQLLSGSDHDVVSLLPASYIVH